MVTNVLFQLPARGWAVINANPLVIQFLVLENYIEAQYCGNEFWQARLKGKGRRYCSSL